MAVDREPTPNRFVDTEPVRPVASRDNRRVTYQEWQRDRPVEATTTYRRIGKVPSPGRSSCTIREPPFGVPPIRPRRSPVPRSRALTSLPEYDHGDRDTRSPHDALGPAHRRHALPQLRREPADRSQL